MTVEELIRNKDYTLLASVKHSEMKNFIFPEIEKRPFWAGIANMYQIGGLFAFMLGLFKAFMPLFLAKSGHNLWWVGGGIVFSFSILIVLHELIHAAAYLAVGAKKLSFGMMLKKFMFYVQADKHVINYRQFQFVALAPTVFVAVLSIAVMLVYYNQPPFYFFVTVFGLHSIFCVGDFGLLCFFANRKDTEIVTYDDSKSGESYFYGKIKNQQ